MAVNLQQAWNNPRVLELEERRDSQDLLPDSLAGVAGGLPGRD